MNVPVKIDGVKCTRDMAEVEFAEVLGNSSRLNFTDGTVGRMRCSLTELIEQYGSDEGLISAHRKFVINLSCVSEIIKYCICKMNCGKQIDLGRDAYRKVCAYKKRQGEKGKNPPFPEEGSEETS